MIKGNRKFVTCIYRVSQHLYCITIQSLSETAQSRFGERETVTCYLHLIAYTQPLQLKMLIVSKHSQYEKPHINIVHNRTHIKKNIQNSQILIRFHL
jgi:hypothetical protein